MIFVYYTSIKDLSWDRLKCKINLLPGEEAERILILKQEKDRLLSLAGKLLLLHALKQNCLWPEYYLPEIQYTSYKRPYFESISADFSISHSGYLVACAITLAGKVGLDVEEIQPVDVNDFTYVLQEYELTEKIKSVNPLHMLYKYWTTKESIMKADGRGVFLDPLSINIKDNQCVIDSERWYLYPLKIEDGYVASLALNYPVNPLLIAHPVILSSNTQFQF